MASAWSIPATPAKLTAVAPYRPGMTANGTKKSATGSCGPSGEVRIRANGAASAGEMAVSIDPCGPDCTLCEADQITRAAYLARHQRYNLSTKGQARNAAYEARHPERKLRWEPARNALRSGLGPPPDAPMNGGADLPPEAPETVH